MKGVEAHLTPQCCLYVQLTAVRVTNLEVPPQSSGSSSFAGHQSDACKLAVIMHQMLKTGELFDRSANAKP